MHGRKVMGLQMDGDTVSVQRLAIGLAPWNTAVFR